MRRTVLTLTLAALLTASGCVTVNGTAPQPAAPAAPSEPAARTGAHAVSRGIQYGAPLTRLPEDPVPADPAPGPVPEPAEAEASPAPLGNHSRRTEGSAADHPSAPHSRPRRLPAPAPRRFRPAPAPRNHPAAPAAGRREMAQLCAASHGITTPTVTQLCTGTYGR